MCRETLFFFFFEETPGLFFLLLLFFNVRPSYLLVLPGDDVLLKKKNVRLPREALTEDVTVFLE